MKATDYELDNLVVLGPVKKRKFTDIIFFIVFVIVIIGFLTVLFYGLASGDINKVAMPIDKDGNICGKKAGYKVNKDFTTPKDLSEYPYLYFTPQAITANVASAFSNRICIKSCPKKNVPLQCSPIYANCGNNSTPTTDTLKTFDRFCLPEAGDVLKAFFNKYFSFLAGQEYLEDIFKAWWAQIVGIIIAILLSIILIVLMKYIAVVIIILMCLLAIGGLGIAGYYLLDKSNTVWLEAGSESTAGAEKLKSESWNWFWAAIIVWIIDALALMFVLCSICVISTAVKVMELAGEFLGNHCSAIFIPLITIGIYVVWIMLWLISLLFLYSMGDVKYKKEYAFSLMTWNPFEKWQFVFLILVLLWISAWILSYTYFAISAAVLQWYFSPITGQKTEVFMGLKLGIVWHCGTIAFGSFLIMLVWIIRAITEWLMEKVRKATGGNKCVLCLINCIRCYCGCFEKFVKFVNSHAYTEVILRSCSFCEGASKGMGLVAENFLVFSFLNAVQTFMNFTLSCGVGAGSSIIVHYILKLVISTNETTIKTTLGVDICVFLFGSVIGRLFFTIYGHTADIILHCYCIDIKKNNVAKGARPKLNNFIESVPKQDRQESEVELNTESKI